MEIKEGYIPFGKYETYYRIANPKGKKTPLVCLHGGPGSTHNIFELFDHVAFEDDRPIICYDQIGCGLSSIPTNHPELWKKETWVNELDNLREALDLKEIHLLGHSWGGMLEIIYMCDYLPKGIKSVTLSSTLSSASLWREETHRLLSLMDKKDVRILLEAEANNKWNYPEVTDAINRYYEKYVFGPWKVGIDPEPLTRKKPSSKESYVTAWGESEFSPSGTLKDYEYIDKLNRITCPVLVCGGKYDESTPLQNKIMYDALGSSKKTLICYENSRHASYYEEHDLYVNNLIKFLNDAD